jgi:hypothetical protein
MSITGKTRALCSSFFSNVHTLDGLVTFGADSGEAEIVRQVGADRWSFFIAPVHDVERFTVIVFLRGDTESFAVETVEEAALSYEKWVREVGAQ